MKLTYLFAGFCAILLWNCQTSKNSNTSSIKIQNPATQARTDAFVTLQAEELRAKYPDLDLANVALYDSDTPVAFQANDRDANGAIDEIAFVSDLAANETKTITLRIVDIKPEFAKRTQAELSHKVGGVWEDRKYIGGTFQNVDELRVPDEHTDHSYYIRYEGPGWESDKVGYRFYLDWRDATDIFGKTTPEMVLQKVGQDGFDSYHELADWGMDVLKVGESLGIGTLGKWHNGKAERVAMTDSILCKIALNGPVESMIQTKYYDWEIAGQKTDVTSELSIAAGSRLTKHDVTLSNNLDSLCTGIVKLDSTMLLQSTDGAWGYLATWGKQSLNNDMLGMGVLFKTSELLQLTEDAHSHVVVLKPNNNQLTYYFLGAWEKEPNGITSQEAFEAYLNSVVNELSNPVKVSY